MTLISHKYKFVFLANPKCASTTLHELLRPYSDEAYTFSVYQKPIGTHADAKTVKRYLKRKGKDIKDYHVITTIREPYARIKSCFRYESHWKHHKDVTDLFRPIPKDFKSYVMGDWFFKRFIDIDKFTRDEKGEELVDTIIKVEEFTEEVPKLVKKLELPLNLDSVPMTNVTAKKKGVDYDEEMKKHIHDFNFGDFRFYPVED